MGTSLLETGLHAAAVPVGVVLQGIVVGSLYGLLAVGLVLVYRATGAVNFAQAQLGAVPAVVALALFSQDDLPYLGALLFVLAGSALVGALVEIGVVRRLRGAAPETITVALVGVSLLLAFGEVLAQARAGGSPLSRPRTSTPLAALDVTVGVVRLTADHALAVVTAVVIVMGLACFLRTGLGTALRASADNPERAVLLGLPVRLTSAIVWGVAGLLSGAALFLASPISGAPQGAGAGPAVLLPGLAAAVVAGMRSLPAALAAGVGLGIVDQTAVFLTGRASLADAILLVIILVALLLRPAAATEPRQGAVESSTALARRRPRTVSAAVVPPTALAFTGAPLLMGREWVGAATMVVLLAMVALSSVVLTGWGGQLSLGQFAFAGVGAAVAGGLAANYRTDFFVTLALAGLAGAGASAIAGFPTIRRGGLGLSVSTLALAVVVESFLLRPAYFGWLLPPDFGAVRRPVLFGALDVQPDGRFYLVCSSFLGLAMGTAAAVRRRRGGRSLVAVRDDPRLAQAQGISPQLVRLAALAGSGALAALAGGLLAYQLGVVEAEAFAAIRSVETLAIAVIGGISSVFGSLGAASLLVGAPLLLTRHVPTVALLSGGVGVLAVLLVRPAGLTKQPRRRSFGRRGIRWRPNAAPSPPGVVTRLECRDVRADYGQRTVLDDVSLQVWAGEVVWIAGSNGVGKSTLLRVISGLLAPSGGVILLDGRDVTGATPEQMTALDVAHAPAGPAVFDSLSVTEHLRLAAWVRRRDPNGPARARRLAFALFPELTRRPERVARILSGGEKRMLSLAMAAAARPSVLLADEPTAGLAPAVAGRIWKAIDRMAEGGCAVVVVEHSAPTAAGRALMLSGAPAHISNFAQDGALANEVEPHIRPAWPSTTTTGRQQRSPVALAVQGINVRFGASPVLSGVALEVARGEGLGVIGPNGSGKTTLLDVISGFVPTSGGRLVLEGVDVSSAPAHRRARLGLARSFQDPRLWPGLTVAEHLSLAGDWRPPPDDIWELLDLGSVWDRPITELSSGTRRLVGLAMTLARRPRVILFDEPSTGLDRAHQAGLGPLLGRIRAEIGCAIVVVEHDLEVVAAACGNVVVLDGGRILASGETTQLLPALRRQ